MRHNFTSSFGDSHIENWSTDPGSEDNLEVLRFALVAENLRGMEGQSLISDMLHPLERYASPT